MFWSLQFFAVITFFILFNDLLLITFVQNFLFIIRTALLDRSEHLIEKLSTIVKQLKNPANNIKIDHFIVHRIDEFGIICLFVQVKRNDEPHLTIIRQGQQSLNDCCSSDR